MFTKDQLDQFRFEAANDVTCKDNIETAIATHGDDRNLTRRRREGSYYWSVHYSVLKQGAEFAAMVMGIVAMHTGPYKPGDHFVSKWVVNKTGTEGSFFYKSQLVRWYVDEHSPGQLSLYVKIDRSKSWLQRISYALTSEKRRNIRSDWRKNFA